MGGVGGEGRRRGRAGGGEGSGERRGRGGAGGREVEQGEQGKLLAEVRRVSGWWLEQRHGGAVWGRCAEGAVFPQRRLSDALPTKSSSCQQLVRGPHLREGRPHRAREEEGDHVQLLR